MLNYSQYHSSDTVKRLIKVNVVDVVCLGGGVAIWWTVLELIPDCFSVIFLCVAAQCNYATRRGQLVCCNNTAN